MIDPPDLEAHASRIGPAYDYLAPDGSQIRLLSNGRNGGLCHCTLPAGATSAAISHATVEELWYFVGGVGEVWRSGLGEHEYTQVEPGTSLVVPVRTAFQFRNTGDVPLVFIIATVPRWPGPQEAVAERGPW